MENKKKMLGKSPAKQPNIVDVIKNAIELEAVN